MKRLGTIWLVPVLVGVCHWATGAQGEVKATQTPVVIKPAEGIPAEPAATAGPGLMGMPPESFDPAAFGMLTTATLPRENGEPVVMRVNGRPVVWADFEAQAKLAGESLMRAHPGKVEGIYAALAEPVMDLLVTQELFREFAEENRLGVHPSEVESRMETARRQMPGAAAMLTEEELKRAVRDTLTREKVTKFIGDRATSAPPTAAELTSFTVNAAPTTSAVELTRARHIVFRATPDMSDFNINDARAKAEEVLGKIRGGMDFATAAQRYSQDRFTAYQGGNIGYYAPGNMYREFEAAAAKLKPGEVSDVVRTPVGFHIIQVTERHQDDLRLQYERFKRQSAVQEWLDEAAREAKVERYLGE